MKYACQETSNNETGPLMVQKHLENNVSMKIQLYYLRQHPTQQNNLLSRQIYLDIVPGHCDLSFRNEEKKHHLQKHIEVSFTDWKILSGALGGFSIFLSVLFLFVFYRKYKKPIKEN